MNFSDCEWLIWLCDCSLFLHSTFIIENFVSVCTPHSPSHQPRRLVETTIVLYWDWTKEALAIVENKVGVVEN